MPSARRRTNTTLIERLSSEPETFSFQQAVRLLEHIAAFEANGNPINSKSPVGQFASPTQEVVQFNTQHNLQFPASEVFAIKRRNGKHWSMTVNLMELSGAMGVLPYHYTEMILQRLKLKDTAFMHFLDLFTHRTISLFFQASCKYRLPIEYERKKINSLSAPKKDTQTQTLLSLIGLGTPHLSDSLHCKAESLIFYGGLFSQKIRSVTGLKHILQHHFKIPVQIKQFIGQKQELITDLRSRLPSISQPEGQNICLGKSTMLGRHGWFAQGKIRIILGPLNHQQFNMFTPGKKAIKVLNEIVQLYVGIELDYDFSVRVKRSDIPMQIQLGGKEKPVMGWNTWMSGMRSLECDMNETVDIHLSGKRLQ